jgi:hypothetical protein
VSDEKKPIPYLLLDRRRIKKLKPKLKSALKEMADQHTSETDISAELRKIYNRFMRMGYNEQDIIFALAELTYPDLFPDELMEKFMQIWLMQSKDSPLNVN